MRKRVLLRTFGIVVAAFLVMGLAVPVLAQLDIELLPFPRYTATIALTNTGMTITPAQLDPGPVAFTIYNNSNQPRGVYVTGLDHAQSRLLRYSTRIAPGGTSVMQFWLYQGSVYTFRDFTLRSITDGRSVFTSTYSTNVTIPTPYPIGRGPRPARQTGEITISSTGINVSPMTYNLGAVAFNVRNETGQPRGVVISGQDRAGSPIIRYSQMIPPGGSTRVGFWLYEGRTYTVRDYTRRYTVEGELQFDSSFSTTLSVRPETPGVTTGAGPADSEEAVMTTVDVGLDQWVVQLSDSTVPAGLIVFRVTNNGEIPHAFAIENGVEARTEDLAPGESAALQVMLEPGMYTAYCPIGNHREMGMVTTLTVE